MRLWLSVLFCLTDFSIVRCASSSSFHNRLRTSRVVDGTVSEYIDGRGEDLLTAEVTEDWSRTDMTDASADAEHITDVSSVRSSPATTCSNDCRYPRDGVCDDSRNTGYCALGTDCQDCGPVGASNFTVFGYENYDLSERVDHDIFPCVRRSENTGSDKRYYDQGFRAGVVVSLAGIAAALAFFWAVMACLPRDESAQFTQPAQHAPLQPPQPTQPTHSQQVSSNIVYRQVSEEVQQ